MPFALVSCGPKEFDASHSVSIITREDGSGTKGAFMEIIGLKGKADVEENIVSAEMLADPVNRDYYCTGVLFKATYIPAGFTEGQTFYWYANKFYRTLSDIATEMGGNIALTDDNCVQYGIYKYTKGTCYYTYWIRHADDGDDTKISPMEYAIVRNNIYQLNVTSVNGIGSVEPTGDAQVIITVYVEDWKDIPTNAVEW